MGGSVTGNIGASGDEDWFKVVLEADKTYQIDLKGEDGGGGTLRDPYLFNIVDSSGTEFEDTENDDIDAHNRDSQIIFTPTTTGDYYLAAGGIITGTYTLSVRDTLPTLSISDAEGDEDVGVEFTADADVGGIGEGDGDLDGVDRERRHGGGGGSRYDEDGGRGVRCGRHVD